MATPIGSAGQRPRIYLALEGAGVHPGNVPLEQLAELLAAAQSAFEQVAQETGRPRPAVALTEIQPGSARYALSAVDPALDDQFAAFAPTIYKAIEERAKGYSFNVQRALRRLHAAGRGGGGVSVQADHVGLGNTRELKRIVMAMPLTEPVSALPATTVIYGKVLAVEAKRTGMQIRVKPSDGSAIELEADERVALRAARLFTQQVEVRAMARSTEEWPWSQWDALSIDPWHRSSSLLEVIDEVARELKVEGLQYDPTALVRSLDEDE